MEQKTSLIAYTNPEVIKIPCLEAFPPLRYRSILRRLWLSVKLPLRDQQTSTSDSYPDPLSGIANNPRLLFASIKPDDDLPARF